MNATVIFLAILRRPLPKMQWRVCHAPVKTG
jgi:hypothetical protein